MATSTTKLVYDFRRKRNSINTGQNQDIPLVDVIAYLNEAQEIWFENRCYVAQTDEKVRNDLRAWKVDMDSLTLLTLDEDRVLAKYPKDLYKRLNQAVIATKDCCAGISKRIPLRIIQSDDLYDSRMNPFRKADFFFEQISAIETNDGLVVYSDGEMDVDTVYVDYYRRPKDLHAPSHQECAEGYYDYAGKLITSDQDFEGLNPYSTNVITDIAVVCASRDVGNFAGFQTQINKILTVKQLQ